MAYHVDIVGLDPMSGKEKLIGRVGVDDGELRIEAHDEDQLRDTLRRIVPDVDPVEDPTGFVQRLPERVDYTHMIASNPHAEDECPFDAIGGEPVREQHDHSEQLA